MENQELKARFAAYAKSFETGDTDVDRNLRLKQKHTFCVVEEAQNIMRCENFTPEETFLGERAALLHDLSRFEQYSRFKTFRDASSFDHGARSVELTEQDNWLADLTGNARRDVIFAIARHNKKEIGETPSPRAGKLAEMLRDADKIDIFRVFLEYLPEQDDPAVTFSLKNKREITPEILTACRARQAVDYAKIAGVADFIAAIIQWSYDLNTQTACRVFVERRLLQQVATFVQDVPELPELINQAQNYLQEKISGR